MKPFYCLLLLFACIAIANMAWAHTCNSDIARTKPDSRYVDNGDGTVTDTVTNLIWMQCSLGQSGADCATGSAKTYTWQGALKAAQAANRQNKLGHSDWRLPNIKELHSLVENACLDPAINSHVFPNTLSGGYWSASPVAYNSELAWYVNFKDGHGYSGNKDVNLRVRLVRGGE